MVISKVKLWQNWGKCSFNILTVLVMWYDKTIEWSDGYAKENICR